MAQSSDLEGFRRDRYLSRSWALLTRDRGWIKPVLVMTVALLVPVVGVLGVLGYALEWSRLTAWGVNAAPKQRDVRVGACIASGWRAFVVALVWGICSAIVIGIATSLPVVGGLVGAVWIVASFFYAVMVMVAQLRSAIYQRIVPGLRVGTIWKMVSHDPGGLVRVAAMLLVGSLVASLIAVLVTFSALASVVPRLMWVVAYLDGYAAIDGAVQAAIALEALFSMIASLAPALVLLTLLDGFVAVVLLLLSQTAVGLWMRQFDVAAWGRDEDPLPDFASDPDAGRPDASWRPANPAPAPDEDGSVGDGGPGLPEPSSDDETEGPVAPGEA